MSKQGPLVIVDDDAEDHELMLQSLKELGLHENVRFFRSAETALAFLYETNKNPFMIVSDINMPQMTGIQFKRAIEKCDILRSKCIPFIFLSTSTKFIEETCNLNIQGYFEKGNSFEYLHETMKIILRYWERTKHSN